MTYGWRTACAALKVGAEQSVNFNIRQRASIGVAIADGLTGVCIASSPQAKCTTFQILQAKSLMTYVGAYRSRVPRGILLDLTIERKPVNSRHVLITHSVELECVDVARALIESKH